MSSIPQETTAAATDSTMFTPREQMLIEQIAELRAELAALRAPTTNSTPPAPSHTTPNTLFSQ